MDLTASEHVETVVVGAGIAGLTVAEAYPSAIIFEARPNVGGRIRTVYNGADVEYEAGPWRISSRHERAIALCKQLGVCLRPLSTQTPRYGKAPSPIPGLSNWDVTALRSKDPRAADKADLETSYADQTHSASGSAPYTAAQGEFYYAPEGLQEICNRLAYGKKVRVDTRVVDIVRRGDVYELSVCARTAYGFEKYTVVAKRVFVCVPPSAFANWSIISHAKSVLHAVEPGELHHIYANSNFPRKKHMLLPNSLLSQVVSSQYTNSSYIQASYTSGRLARFWHNLLLQMPQTFAQLLQQEVKRFTGYNIATEDIKSHHWPNAYHKWKTVPNFSLEHAVRMAVMPNPIDLPRVYIAGEAYSSLDRDRGALKQHTSRSNKANANNHLNLQGKVRASKEGN